MTDGTRVPLTVEDGRSSVADDLFTNNGNEDRKGCVELELGAGVNQEDPTQGFKPCPDFGYLFVCVLLFSTL